MYLLTAYNIILHYIQEAPSLYGVDFSAPPALDDDDATVTIPDIRFTNYDLCLQELERHINPLDEASDSDYGISSYCNALHLLATL